jgi:hypothetical protein
MNHFLFCDASEVSNAADKILRKQIWWARRGEPQRASRGVNDIQRSKIGLNKAFGRKLRRL